MHSFLVISKNSAITIIFCEVISSVYKSTYSVEVVDDPDFTVLVLQVILDVVLLHAHTHVFLNALTVVFLELMCVLQQNIAERVQSLTVRTDSQVICVSKCAFGNCAAWNTDVTFYTVHEAARKCFGHLCIVRM